MEARMAALSTSDKAAGDKGASSKKEMKKETLLGLNVTRAEDFGAWYSQVVTAGEMIEYYDGTPTPAAPASSPAPRSWHGD